MAEIQQEETQQELFTEFSGATKRVERFPKIAKTHKPLLLRTTIEQGILVGIGLILTGCFVFFLGVLRGKYLSVRVPQVWVQKKAQASPATPQKTAAFTGAPVKAAAYPQAPSVKSATEPPARVNKPYTIQLSTYRKQDLAEKEVVELRRSGFYSTLISSNGYYVVCAGQYDTKEAAKKDLKIFSAKYKDCFLRRRVQPN